MASHSIGDRESSVHKSIDKKSKISIPTMMRQYNSTKKANRNASSMFKSGVERLPEISGRHTSMTTGCPGPGEYSQANKSIDFAIKQQ